MKVYSHLPVRDVMMTRTSRHGQDQARVFIWWFISDPKTILRNRAKLFTKRPNRLFDTIRNVSIGAKIKWGFANCNLIFFRVYARINVHDYLFDKWNNKKICSIHFYYIKSVKSTRFMCMIPEKIFILHRVRFFPLKLSKAADGTLDFYFFFLLWRVDFLLDRWFKFFEISSWETWAKVFFLDYPTLVSGQFLFF